MLKFREHLILVFSVVIRDILQSCNFDLFVQILVAQNLILDI